MYAHSQNSNSAKGLRTDVWCNHENQERRLSLRSKQIELCSSKTRTADTKCITKKWKIEMLEIDKKLYWNLSNSSLIV